MTGSCVTVSFWAASSCVTTSSHMTGSFVTVSSWEAGSCVTAKLKEELGSCLTVILLTTKDNGRRMGNSYSIFFHLTAASADLVDLVLLLGNVEIKTRDFLFLALG
jgi:hypothetical protein